MSHVVYNPETEDEKECRVLIVGYAGSGKSTLGNKLISKTSVEAFSTQGNLQEGDQPRAGFMVSRGFDSATRKSQYQTGRLQWGSQTLCVKVVDTPGLFDPSDQGLRVARVEILRAVSLSCPGGPHAVLFVVPFGRFTEQEDRAFEEVLQLLGGKEAVKDHLVVVFTHGEDLDTLSIEDVLGNSQVQGLRRIKEVVGNRYVVSTNDSQRWPNEVRSLMAKVLQVSDNCAKCYSNPNVPLGKIDLEIHSLVREEGVSREEAVQEIGKRLFEDSTMRTKRGRRKYGDFKLGLYAALGVWGVMSAAWQAWRHLKK